MHLVGGRRNGVARSDEEKLRAAVVRFGKTVHRAPEANLESIVARLGFAKEFYDAAFFRSSTASFWSSSYGGTFEWNQSDQ